MSSIQTIAYNTLHIDRLLGHGGYGDVFKGTWYGKEVAIKELLLKKMPDQLLKDFENEMRIMSQCKCAQVINLLGVCMETGHYAMVMEYMSRGSLDQVLHDEKEPLPWDPIRFQIAIDIGKGLAYLHQAKIVHRDLKSLNVLVDQNYHAKITDFGLAKIKLQTSSTSTQSGSSLGTVRWLAPELLKRGASPTFSSDIYAAGMVFWELSSRKIPFSDASNEQLVLNWIKEGERETIPPECPEKMGQLIMECWDLAPEMRPTAEQLSSKLIEAAPLRETTQERYWHVDSNSQSILSGQKYTLEAASPNDIKKAGKFYAHHPIPGYEIQSVRAIYNPTLIGSFRNHLEKLQERSQSSAFDPKWSWEMGNSDWRREVHKKFLELSQTYTDSDYPSVKLLPLWHGTDPSIVDSICRSGYANLSSTDTGFYGRGLYSAHEAEYAFRVYSKGALILNWVAIYSEFPVLEKDLPKLTGKPNYQNYDAHFIPVSPMDPNNPREVNYYPSPPNTTPHYHEVVVFESAACLPSYLVELKKTGNGPIIQEKPRASRALPPPPKPSPYLSNQSSVSAPVKTYSGLKEIPQKPHAQLKKSITIGSASSNESQAKAMSSPYPQRSTVDLPKLPSKPPVRTYTEAPKVDPSKKQAEEFYELGLKYYSGVGVIQNYTTAAQNFQLAADKGHAIAQFKLGMCYKSGNLGVPIDREKEQKYLQMALGQGIIAKLQASAQQGNVHDQNHLGLCYESGIGVPKDDILAFKYFKMAADQGDASALNNLGLLYESGQGIPQDYVAALQYYRAAVAKGNGNAQYNFGMCHEKGLGTNQDYKEAMRNYYLSANQGNTFALNNLGILYRRGTGVPQNLNEAFRYYKLAADLGNENAQFNVGLCYETGQGIAKNLEEALKYYRLAANQGDKKAEAKINLTKK